MTTIVIIVIWLLLGTWGWLRIVKETYPRVPVECFDIFAMVLCAIAGPLTLIMSFT